MGIIVLNSEGIGMSSSLTSCRNDDGTPAKTRCNFTFEPDLTFLIQLL